MTQRVLESTPATVKHLKWDSDHFDLPVAQILPGEIDDVALRQALLDARTQRYRLVYWATSSDRELPDCLLVEFGGAKVDQKVTYVREMTPDALGDGVSPEKLVVEPYGSRSVSRSLLELAMAAGIYSRFGVDQRFPRHKYEELYRVWIERSVRREIAGEVLAVRGEADDEELAGMVTVKVADSVGNIGLIAVAEDFRGRGIGTLLIHAAHRWMHEQGATQMNVITQLANTPACRLYERNGYRLDDVQCYYHFWL